MFDLTYMDNKTLKAFCRLNCICLFDDTLLNACCYHIDSDPNMLNYLCHRFQKLLIERYANIVNTTRHLHQIAVKNILFIKHQIESRTLQSAVAEEDDVDVVIDRSMIESIIRNIDYLFHNKKVSITLQNKLYVYEDTIRNSYQNYCDCFLILEYAAVAATKETNLDQQDQNIDQLYSYNLEYTTIETLDDSVDREEEDHLKSKKSRIWCSSILCCCFKGSPKT